MLFDRPAKTILETVISPLMGRLSLRHNCFDNITKLRNYINLDSPMYELTTIPYLVLPRVYWDPRDCVNFIQKCLLSL